MHILEFNALLIPCQKEKDVELSLLKKNYTSKIGCQFTMWRKCFKKQAVVELQDVRECENYKFYVFHFFRF